MAKIELELMQAGFPRRSSTDKGVLLGTYAETIHTDDGLPCFVRGSVTISPAEAAAAGPGFMADVERNTRAHRAKVAAGSKTVNPAAAAGWATYASSAPSSTIATKGKQRA